MQVARWLPERQIVAVTDSEAAAIDLLNAVRHRISMISRLHVSMPGCSTRRRTAGAAQSVDHASSAGVSRRWLSVSPIPPDALATLPGEWSGMAW